MTPKVNCTLNYLQESVWEPGYLRAKCKELDLESEFQAYQIRLFRSHISIFFALHFGVTLINCILIWTLALHKAIIYFDLAIYSGTCVILFLILSINFCENLTDKHTWIMFVSSALAVVIVVGTDLIQSLYHHYVHDWQCGSFYDTYILYIIYLFLPILSIQGAIALGVIVSLLYILYFVNILSVALNEDLPIEADDYAAMSVDIIHYLCINMLGIFSRLVNDMVVRSSFLDRHQFIKEKNSLTNAQKQEKLLLDSILPPQFSELLQKDIKKRINLSKQQPLNNFDAFRRSMAIQTHTDVSILYADVVNYTYLTTTLTVEKLVTTLHDLYARFDVAALHYNVQRIKFLGDCYYCVGGLTSPNPDHATNTVALGIAMIGHIQEVRNIQNLDINMRIGVHCGSLFAGVIGEAKLQYDVWGPDVTIANILESTGVPGAVHISGAVLRHLASDQYEITKGPEKAKNDPILQKHKITTYLIVYDAGDANEVESQSTDTRSILNLISSSPGELEKSLSTVLRDELHKEYREMPVIQFDLMKLCSSRRQEESRKEAFNQVDIFLTFYDNDLEKAYMKQKDYLFKYHMLLAWIFGNSLVYIQVMDTEGICIVCITINILVSLSLSVLVFIAWYKKICWMRFGKADIPHRYSRISCALFRILEKIQESLSIRVCTYLFVIALNWIVIGLITLTCYQDEFIMNYIEEKIYHYDNNKKICFHPWVATNMVALMVCMSLTFTHIPFLLKTTVALAQTLTHCVFVFILFDFVFHHSATTNPFFPSEYAHAFIIWITFVTIYLKTRHTEFAKKVNFNSRCQLEKKQNDAAITNRSIIILLNNILPTHVVDIYLNSLAQDELYCESYKMVSVMFAMLTDFQIDIRSLRILNEIITQFDVLLMYYKEYYVVEKIKIVNCTYMAACGLDVNFAGATSRPLRLSSFDKERRSTERSEDQEEVVFVMASFALDLMRTLVSCNKSYNKIVGRQDKLDGKIAIGISSGEIMAGIVGATKPHYDIWGDPVNMASRMEMTGLPGHIHVTEESANILQTFGIQSNYRGQTFVKGRGKIPTYLLGIDETYNFIYKEGERKPGHAERSTVISLTDTYS